MTIPKTYYSSLKRSDVKDFYNKAKDFSDEYFNFDIEEWFHILDHDSTKNEKQWNNYEYRLEANMDKIFSLLHIANQNATFCLDKQKISSYY